MVATTTFIVEIFLLLAAAVIAGEVATRLGQAALVGQLLVGVVLGPTVFGSYLGLTQSNVELTGIQVLATFFVLITAGLEVRPEEVFNAGAAATTLGVCVFLGPFLLGAFVVPLLFPGVGILTALFISLTLSITALPVMAIMLREFGIGRSKMGVLLMNTAVINELTAVTVFAILLRLSSSSGWISFVIAALSVGIFLGSVLALHFFLRALREAELWPALQARFRAGWRSKEGGFALLMVMALASALYSQYLGLTFLVGAFYAGLLITPESTGTREHRSISQVFDAITWGFFVPIFFAFVGLDMNLTSLATSAGAIGVFGILCVFAVGSKLGLGAAIARFFGWSTPESLAIGFMVSSRGAVELAMAVILLQDGIFTTGIYTVVAGVGLVTTIVAPIGAAAYGHLTRGGPMAALRQLAPSTSTSASGAPAASLLR